MDADLAPTRKLLPWALGALLVAFIVGVLFFTLVVHREAAGQLAVELEDDLRDRVESWESDLVRKLTTWSEVAAANRYQAQTYQQQLRDTAPWFDSLYLWTPAQQITTENQSILINGRFLFPDAPLLERDEMIAQVHCLKRARAFASQPGVDTDEAVRAWQSWCRGEPLFVRMLALSEAAHMLSRERRWADTVELLEREGLDPRFTLADAARLGVPPFRAVVLALQHADALWNLGREEEASLIDFRTGMDITTLDGPQAEGLQPLLAYPLLPRVRARQDPRRTRMLEAAARRLARRVNGYREVRDQLLPRRVPSVPEEPRFIRDQYGDAPFLLFTHWAAGGEVGVALQLDQEELVQDLIDHMGLYRYDVVITDSSGSYIAGARRGGPVAISVPFGRTLTHLRVGLRSRPLDRRMERLNLELRLAAAGLVLLLVVALAMLYGIVSTNRTQRLLLQRQREFATRVTHELKTPLAGIKIMAENLELGHYDSDRERAAMARSIVREADNLTHRVNEILAVTRERKLKKPEPFDPEEPLFEVVEQWGPRLEVAGIHFEADLQPTDEVLGDPEALRDAVACLIDNALKYRREDVEARVRLELDQEEDRIRICVSDNGIGVPPAMREAIFERFVRVEGDNRGKAGGHGLGLAQVAQIVREHRGTVRCEESDDGGARFVIELPAHR